ncbi:Fc.00g115850.m01.CDS01 [Cosmosporella sp. VM-42]
MTMHSFALLFFLAWAACASIISVSNSFIQRGDEPDFTFDYSTTSADPRNWVAVYHAEHGGPKKEKYVENSLVWAYAAHTHGTVHLSISNLEPGTYEAYFLAKDGYQWLADPIIVYRKPDPVAFFTDEVTLQNGRVGDPFRANISGLLGGGGGDVTVEYSITSSQEGNWVEISSDGNLSGTPTRASQALQLTVTASASDNSTSHLDVRIPVVSAGSPLVEQFSVLTYNMWFGGTQVNNYHAKQVAFLASSNLDIVVLQESWNGQASRLGRALGWHSWQGSRSVGIISRYPIVEEYPQQTQGGSVRVALDGEEAQVNVWGVHLAYTPYGPYDFCFDNMTVDEVLAREESSGRGRQIRETLVLMKGQLTNSNKIPVILAGDFNAPSHLDWTHQASDIHCGFGNVAWPTSKGPFDSGLIDTFRKVHPDPLSDPGITWSPIYLDNGGRSEPLDRIDIIYYKGRLRAVSADKVIVGHPKPEPDHANNDWTSDHAAVLVRYDLKSFVRFHEQGEPAGSDDFRDYINSEEL